MKKSLSTILFPYHLRNDGGAKVGGVDQGMSQKLLTWQKTWLKTLLFVSLHFPAYGLQARITSFALSYDTVVSLGYIQGKKVVATTQVPLFSRLISFEIVELECN